MTNKVKYELYETSLNLLLIEYAKAKLKIKEKQTSLFINDVNLEEFATKIQNFNNIVINKKIKDIKITTVKYDNPTFLQKRNIKCNLDNCINAANVAVFVENQKNTFVIICKKCAK